jgi:hypothetical protein
MIGYVGQALRDADAKGRHEFLLDRCAMVGPNGLLVAALRLQVAQWAGSMK